MQLLLAMCLPPLADLKGLMTVNRYSAWSPRDGMPTQLGRGELGKHLSRKGSGVLVELQLIKMISQKIGKFFSNRNNIVYDRETCTMCKNTIVDVLQNAELSIRHCDYFDHEGFVLTSSVNRPSVQSEGSRAQLSQWCVADSIVCYILVL